VEQIRLTFSNKPFPSGSGFCLDQAILDVIDNPEKTQQITAIGTLF
jgi:hypothetical protein